MGWSLNKKNRPKSVISEVLSLATTGVEGFLLRTSCASPPPRLHSLSPTSCRLFALRRAHSAVRLPKFLRFKHKKKQTDPLLAYQENYSLSHYGSRRVPAAHLLCFASTPSSFAVADFLSTFRLTARSFRGSTP